MSIWLSTSRCCGSGHTASPGDVEHLRRWHDGPTDKANLALACVGCSLRKGARQHAIDPEVGTDAPLFNPRTDTWSEHVAWDGVVVTGRSATGRATTAALAMNRPLMIAIREEEIILGRHAGN